MSSHISSRHLALALVAACTAALVVSNAQALPTTRWTGSVTCTLTTSGSRYADQQVQTWNIMPGAVTPQGPSTFYTEDWTDSGTGGNPSATWTTNGRGHGTIVFTVIASTGKLHIGLGSAATRDNTGTLVRPQGGAPYTAPAYEWAFPLIEVPANSTDVHGSSQPPVNGKVGFQEPADGKTTATCSWTLHFGAVVLQPPSEPLPPHPPGS
jgi:hypothetical protein